MSSTNRGRHRVTSDNYATPEWVVHRLLDALDLPSGVWLDPCGGDGAIIRAVASAGRTGIKWYANDSRPECLESMLASGAHASISDFLQTPNVVPERVDVILTNPPYNYAMEFIETCVPLARNVVFLLRLNFLASEKRAGFLRKYCPDVYVLSNRPSFLPFAGQTDSIEYAWMHWHDEARSGRLRVLGSTPKAAR